MLGGVTRTRARRARGHADRSASPVRSASSSSARPRHCRPGAAADRGERAGTPAKLRRAGAREKAGSPRARPSRMDQGISPAPLLVGDLPPSSTILTEELFGPLLAVQRVRDVRQACEIVDGLPFALTGGLFSRSPQTVRRGRGANAGRQSLHQPGDHRERSSVASRSAATVCRGRARRRAALTICCSFVEPRAVSENTMRHGLAM